MAAKVLQLLYQHHNCFHMWYIQFPTFTLLCCFHVQTITVNHGTLEQEAEIAATGMHDNRQNCFRFQFHHVLHNAGQDTIYDGLARDVVQGAVDGISGEESMKAEHKWW